MTGRVYLIISVIVIITVAVVFIIQWPDDKFHYIHCDVGQGDAIIITRGFSQILFDTGRGSEVVHCLTRQLPLWDRQLDVVVVTHPDTDHAGGLDEVADYYRIKTLVTNAEPVSAWDVTIREIAGRHLVVSDKPLTVEVHGVVLDFIWPDTANTLSYEDNDISVVTRVKMGNFTALVTGDISQEVENMLSHDLTSVVLKVAHHGSKYSSGDFFLNRVSPKLATIGVGENSYGHPAPETLQRLESRGIDVHRTDRTGDIEIVSDGKTWQIIDP